MAGGVNDPRQLLVEQVLAEHGLGQSGADVREAVQHALALGGAGVEQLLARREHEARAAERAAVVAWLRGWWHRSGGAESPSGLADEIEAGLHLRGAK